jgi:hypothetical protein
MTSTNQNLSTDFFAWGIGRVTLGLGASSLNECYWDDIAFVAMPPGQPTMGTPTVLSTSQIQWSFASADNSFLGWTVADGAGAIVAPAYPTAGWLDRNQTSWTESGLAANTQYARKVRAWNGTVDSAYSQVTAQAWTLSVAPTAGSVTPDGTVYCVDDDVTWTAGGFGPGGAAYYAYAWDQSPAHTFTGSEPVWSSGPIMLPATAPGTWYLHVQGYNGADVPNGTFDYAVEVDACLIYARADFDHDGDVDQADHGHFQICVSGENTPQDDPDCQDAKLDTDSDVDMDDLTVFLGCMRGAGVPADPGCAE